MWAPSLRGFFALDRPWPPDTPGTTPVATPQHAPALSFGRGATSNKGPFPIPGVRKARNLASGMNESRARIKSKPARSRAIDDGPSRIGTIHPPSPVQRCAMNPTLLLDLQDPILHCRQVTVRRSTVPAATRSFEHHLRTALLLHPQTSRPAMWIQSLVRRVDIAGRSDSDRRSHRSPDRTM